MEYKVVTPTGLIREGYSILTIELDSTLNNIEELYNGRPVNNILSVLLDKIKITKLNYPEEFGYDVMQELLSLENEIYSSIIRKFEEEFFDGESYISDNFQDISLNIIAEYIYKYFFLNRKNILDTYLGNTLFVNKTNIAKRYKTSKAKKDITYQAIRNELNVNSPDLYIVVMYASDICEDILMDDELDIVDIFKHYEMSEEDDYLTEKLFEFTGNKVCNILTNNLKNSDSFEYFKSSFKSYVFNLAKRLE